MKKIIEFLKTCLSGGFFVLLPLVLFYLLADELIELMVAMATPIADLFPSGMFDELELPGVIAAILLLGASFVLGVALRSANLRRLGHWVEQATIGQLPLYTAVKRLAQGLVGATESGVFKPALLTSPDGEQEIVYLIEDDGGEHVTVLVPWAPASFAGSVKILSRDRVVALDSNLGDTSRVLAHWGVGALELLSQAKTNSGDRKDANA